MKTASTTTLDLLGATFARGETTPGIYARVRAFLRRHLQKRTSDIELESIAPLDAHLLADIGISDEMRSIAQARHASHYDRYARSSLELHGAASRFGP